MKRIQVIVKIIDLVLKIRYLCIQLSEFFGIFEAVGATVRCILALKFQVAASLARRVSVTLNLSPLALIADDRSVGLRYL